MGGATVGARRRSTQVTEVTSDPEPLKVGAEPSDDRRVPRETEPADILDELAFFKPEDGRDVEECSDAMEPYEDYVRVKLPTDPSFGEEENPNSMI